MAPGAVGHTFGAALKLIDPATRTDYGVGIGRYIGLPFHRILSSSTCPYFLNLVLFKPFPFVHSDLPVAWLCTLWVAIGMKASARRALMHQPHGVRFICHMV